MFGIWRVNTHAREKARPRGMSTSPATLRLKPRLSHLTSTQLLDLAAELASATAEGLRIADARLAEHVVLPEGMWSTVLLNEDLVRRVMRTLGAVDRAASQVCRLWHTCWRATLLPRRILHLDGMPVHSGNASHQIVALNGQLAAVGGRADGSNMAVDQLDRHMYLWDRQLKVVQSAESQCRRGADCYMAIGNSSLYVCYGHEGPMAHLMDVQEAPQGIHRYSLGDFTTPLAHDASETLTFHMCIAGGLVFASLSPSGMFVPEIEEEQPPGMLRAFDAATRSYSSTSARRSTNK